MFRAYSKIQGIINHFEDYNQTSQTETGLVFIVDYESYFFLLVATFVIFTFHNVLLSLLMHIWTQHVSSNVLPCWFLVSGKPTNWLFNNLLC